MRLLTQVGARCRAFSNWFCPDAGNGTAFSIAVKVRLGLASLASAIVASLGAVHSCNGAPGRCLFVDNGA